MKKRATLLFLLSLLMGATTVTDGPWDRYASTSNSAPKLASHTTRALCEAAVPTPSTQQCRQRVTIKKTVDTIGAPQPDASVPVPIASAAPVAPTPALSSHSSTHWLVTVPAVSSARINVFTQPSADSNLDSAQQTYLGSIQAGVSKFLVPKQAGAWLRLGAQNSAGWDSRKSDPLPLFVGVPVVPPPSGVQPLAWDDHRVRWWIRTDKTNQEMGNRFPTAAVQGVASNCAYTPLQDMPEPNTNIDPRTGQPRLVLGRSGGYFQHRIWDGMCLWEGVRQRSSIHTSGNPNKPANTADLLYGKSYWFAFGGKFHADLFSQTDPSDNYMTMILDFHHWGGGSALSGQSPWQCYTNHLGYECMVLWNRNDSGVTSPTGETHWDGAQRVTTVRDRSKDTVNPHFIAWRFHLDYSVNGQVKPYVEAWRQIGVDGPITRLGRWDVPTTYFEPTGFLFVKHGLHQWTPPLSGQPTRSLDYAGALIVEDVTLTPEVIFRSLTVAIPR